MLEKLKVPGLLAAAQAQHQVQRRLLLDVIVRQRSAILQLLARENQALLIGRNACSKMKKCQHVDALYYALVMRANCSGLWLLNFT